MERSAVSIPSRRSTVFLAAATLLSFALAPAWLRMHGEGTAAVAIYAFFSKVCHQHAERSLLLFGVPTAVCVRCLGIYAGAAIGSLVRVERGVAMRSLGVALAINCFDVAAESIGLHGNLPRVRLLIGASLGVAVGALLSMRESKAESGR